jgi:hypothetical protein
VIPVLATIDETGATELRQKIAAVKKLPQERPTFWQSLDEKAIFSRELEHEIGTIVRELGQLADRAVVKVGGGAGHDADRAPAHAEGVADLS